jgi:putative membrane protein
MDAHLIVVLSHWAVSALALLIVAHVVPGFKVSNFKSALFAALVIGAANAVIWPLLIFLTLPINILTLGLFTFVINGAVLKISAALIPGFRIEGWLSAIFGSIVLAIVSSVIHGLLV